MASYTETVVLAWSLAGQEAQRTHHAEIEPPHFLAALCKLCELPLELLVDVAAARGREQLPRMQAEVDRLRAAVGQARLEPTAFRRRLRERLQRAEVPASPGAQLHRSPAARQAWALAEAAANAACEPLECRHLLLALLARPDPLRDEVLAEFGTSAAEWRDAVAAARQGGGQAAPTPAAEPGEESPLAQYGRDLTALARAGRLTPVIGRRDEQRAVAQALLQKIRNNVVLLGEAGVGKTAVVEGLAQRLAGPGPPAGLGDMRLVEISMAALVAGTKYRGEFEARLRQVVSLAAADPHLVLFIDELHTMVGAGGEGSSDAANILKPALSGGDVRCIGATTVAEYRRHIEPDAALARRFQPVWIEPPTREQTLEILAGLRPVFEQHHGLPVTDEALRAAVDLALRYLDDVQLPAVAIDLIDQACAQARLVTLSASAAAPSQPIGRDEVAAVVARRARVPVERLTAGDADRLPHLEDDLRCRVIGQDEALGAVAERIRAAEAGLTDPRRPLAVFLFAGRSGTGKTELAKALAEVLFGSEDRLIALDMSEYRERHTVSRLIGAPPGYVGHGEDGQLTGPVRSHPASVVLFDEIEKAHPDVLNLLLQIGDEGRLTDAQGRTASFRETVVVLTTNLGAHTAPASPAIGFRQRPDDHKQAAEAEREAVAAAVRAALPPELLNRVSRWVVFEPLAQAALEGILDKMLAALGQRLAERGVRLRMDPEAKAMVIAEGCSEEYGARHLQRALDRLLAQPLAELLLAGAVPRDATVRCVLREGAIALQVDPAA